MAFFVQLKDSTYYIYMNEDRQPNRRMAASGPLWLGLQTFLFCSRSDTLRDNMGEGHKSDLLC